MFQHFKFTAPCMNQVAEHLIDNDEFVDTGSAKIAVVMAFFTALRRIKRYITVVRQFEKPEFKLAGLLGFFAILAECPDKALGKDTNQTGRE